MGIFRNITKSLKKAAPLIGSAIGMYFGGPLGASIGSGIGSLAAGKDAEEALRNAALAGATTYAMGGKDFGKGFKFSTADSPLRTMFQGADTSVINKGVKSTGGESFLSKLIPESTMGQLALAGGVGALLGGLGEEEKQTSTKMPPFPKGTLRLGTGQIGNKFYNLNDEEERKQYFDDLREQQKEKDKEDDDVRAFARGGLNALGAQIARQVTQPIQGKMDQIGPFLDEVKTSAEQKFGVTLNGQGGGMGMNQFGVPLAKQNPSALFDLMKANTQTTSSAPKDYSATGVRPAYMPMDEDGDGIDQFGAVMPQFEKASPFEGMTEEEGTRLLSDTFGQGVTQSVGSSPFGAGTTRLGGLGAMSRLFMNKGGSVNKAMGGIHRFYNFPTDTLRYIANKPDDYTEAEQRIAASILATRPPMIDPMQAIGAPDGSGGMMNGGEVNGPGTGTSDSVPARLSDGEFVLTAKAVRGAGGGDRNIGAARMYDMMSKLERVA